MSTAAPNTYLRNAVMTATPEQLQLMLYDGAIRFASQGGDAIEQDDYEASFETLSRAQKIVLELRAGVRREANPELCDQMTQLYHYIYQRLVDGSINRDAETIREAVKLLEYQRETWVMLLERIGRERAADDDAAEDDESEGGLLCVEG